MATDARISTGLPRHPKTKKLLRRLGTAGPWALVCLIAWTSSSRPNGSFAGMSDEDIELAAEWDGEDGAFVAAMVEVKFLDGEPLSRSLHDWAEHNPWAAGHEERSESAKWAALCKSHGAEGAAQRMPEYANRVRSARAPDAGRTKPQCAPDAPLPSSPSPSVSFPTPKPTPVPNQVVGVPEVVLAEPRSDSTPSIPPEPAVVSIPLHDKSEFSVTQSQIDEWTASFPAVDVMQQLREMRQWSIANPTQKKTRRGVLAFITRWLGREQDKGAPGAHQFFNRRLAIEENNRTVANGWMPPEMRAARQHAVDQPLDGHAGWSTDTPFTRT